MIHTPGMSSDELLIFARRVAKAIAAPSAFEWLVSNDDPRASLARGAAGNALVLVEVSRALARPDFLAPARQWLSLGRRLAKSPVTAFGEKALDLEFAAYDGLWSGRGGADYVEVLLADAENDAPERRAAIGRLGNRWRRLARRPAPPSFMAGAAGYLEASASLLASLRELDESEARVLRQVQDEASQRVEAGLDVMSDGTDLSMGFGQCGIAFAALRTATSARTLEYVARLASQRRSAASGTGAWPRIVGGAIPGELPHTWCNGSAGWLSLFTRAYFLTNDARWLPPAGDAAKDAAEMPLGNPTLCCGAAGRALLLTDYARATGLSQYDARARQLLDYAIARVQELVPSLLNGAGGVALAALSVALPNARRAPGFAPMCAH